VQKFSGKSPLPKWNLGLNNTFNYKAFDLSIFFSGQLGQYVYSNTANGFFTAGSLASGRNTTKEVANSNESNINSPDVSTRFLYNASFLRLQNATIGYNWTPKVNGISKLRFYVTGSNLFVITSYPYQDPEVSVSKVLNNVPSAGIDYTTYPKARTFTFGVNATF
jgi:iron complex outermembrane receptor protein